MISPAGILPPDTSVEELFDFDLETTTLIVKSQTSFSFLDEIAQVKVTLTTDADFTLSASITVNYVGNGPWFKDQEANLSESNTVPDITCSEQDKDWVF